MHHIHRHLFWLLLLLVLWGASSPVMASPPSCIVTPKVSPGGVVFITIAAPAATRVTVSQGTTTVIADRRADGSWEAVLGIPAATPPGVRTLTITDSAGATTRATYTVVPRAFPIQRLRMARDQEAKYSSRSVAEEYRLISAALRQVTDGRAWAGGFRLPVDGRLSTSYGVQRYRNGKKVGIHKGIDLAAVEGAPVYAANSGTVVLRRRLGLHGNSLVIVHGSGVAGLYLHLSAFGVSEGQVVQAGQLIGRVGHTGAATGPHLHYGLYVHGTPIDALLLRSVSAGW